MQKKLSRFKFVYLFFIFLFSILALKIIYLQVFKRDFWQRLAQKQHYGLFQIRGKRGRILDCNKDTIAGSVLFFSVFADPFLIKDKENTAAVLAQELGISKKVLAEKFRKKNRRFVWVKRKITWKQKKDIESLNLPGIGFRGENQRFYPEGNLFSSVLGIVGIDNNGLEGIELYYDKYLQGKRSWTQVLQDSSSQKLILTPVLLDSQKGADLTLALDTRIQYWAKKYLRETIEKYRAKKGSLVVMNAAGGQILALANYGAPSFKSGNSHFQKNSAVTDIFEPGSVFKPITLVAAIGEGLSFDKIDCEQGSFKIPGTVLHDWRDFGRLSFEDVFCKSSNIGVAKIANRIGHDKIYEYIKKFEFGKKTGIDFPGETKGTLRPVDKWSKTSRYIIPIGQGIGVNLLQLARAFAAIANGGYLVTPHLGKTICSKGSCTALSFLKKRILPEPLAVEAKDILVKVVETGTGRRAKIEGERIGGKTGTAQKYDPKLGRYSSDRYQATFVGFIDRRKGPVVIGVTVDEPRLSHFGGVIAAPLFRKVAEKIISYKILDE